MGSAGFGKITHLARNLVGPLITITAALSLPATVVHGQIYLTKTSATGQGTVGAYDFSGAPISTSLVSGLSNPKGVSVSDGYFYVVNQTGSLGSGSIGKYTASGATVNASLISGSLGNPRAIAVSGTDLFTGAYKTTFDGSGDVYKYTTSGQLLNSPLVSGAYDLAFMAVSGGSLFVGDEIQGTIGEVSTSGANPQVLFKTTHPEGIAASGDKLFIATAGGTIGEYSTSGATINASLVTGLNQPLGLAVYGDDLFVVNSGNGTVGEYTTSGATVNASLISGLVNPYGIAVAPEPTFGGVLVAGAGSLLAIRRRTCRSPVRTGTEVPKSVIPA
jgi:hypothetical protein